jgi:KamA family protein
MHCRYCFRQHYDYIEPDLERDIAQIAADPSLYEIILSGGDPLSLSDDKLTTLIRRLEEIPHLKLLRFHTRFPIGIPERITEEFLSLLAETRLQTIIVLHINHPRELDEDIKTACRRIQQTGTPILCQTVLLRDVNDTVETLEELSIELISCGIMPYYLHQLDRVAGAARFEVDLAHGKGLIAELRRRLPGYAVPQYVQEIAGEASKTPLTEQQQRT